MVLMKGPQKKITHNLLTFPTLILPHTHTYTHTDTCLTTTHTHGTGTVCFPVAYTVKPFTSLSRQQPPFTVRGEGGWEGRETYIIYFSVTLYRPVRSPSLFIHIVIQYKSFCHLNTKPFSQPYK